MLLWCESWNRVNHVSKSYKPCKSCTSCKSYKIWRFFIDVYNVTQNIVKRRRKWPSTMSRFWFSQGAYSKSSRNYRTPVTLLARNANHSDTAKSQPWSRWNILFFCMELLTFSIRSSDVDTQDENTYSCKCAQNAHERYRFARCLPANAARFPPSTRRSPPVRSDRRLPRMQKRAAKSLVTSATFRCTPFAASGEHIKWKHVFVSICHYA